MAMNFFEHQEKARRSTSRLVILFILAVVAIIAVLYFFFACSLVLLGEHRPEKFSATGLWQPYTLLYVAGGTLLCSGLASLIKISSLSSGGSELLPSRATGRRSQRGAFTSSATGRISGGGPW